MCQHNHPHSHNHAEHGHSHTHAAPEKRSRNHVEPAQSSRRDFLRVLTGGALAGASMLELAWHRAAWARTAAEAAATDASLFNLQRVADGVFFAQAKAQTIINCNAAVFVRSKDVVVVDAHSKPSAATALIAQIKREITPKPVRYVINSHFHWDHSQGNHAYRTGEPQIDFIATSTTKQLLQQFAEERLKASVDAVPQQIEALRKRAEKSTSSAEKTFCADEIRHMQAYVSEMKGYTLELPTITFDKSYQLHDPAFELHLEFMGHAHTAGDLFVFCPQRRAVATGDASHGWLPFIADGYPKKWPGTIDAVAKGEFDHVMGGHGPLQHDRTVMIGQRNYIEELAERVEQAKKTGQSLAEMQKRITVASLRSMHSNGYQAFLERSQAAGHPHLGPLAPLQDGVNTNVAEVYKNIDRV